jgi:CrcB protein
MQNLFLVAIGGAGGACLRYLFIEMVILMHRGSAFPVGTILVNVIGSFLMGIFYFFMSYYLESVPIQVRLLVATGFLGGFTTFSAFSVDVLRLMVASQYVLAFAYIFSSIIFSILAIFAGFYLSKILFV